MSQSDSIFPLETDSLRRRSVRGAAATAISQAAKFFILIGWQIVMARLLEPADFGIFAMVSPVLGFVTIMADLGLLQAIIQRPTLTSDLLNRVFWINIVASGCLSLALMASAPLLVWIYREPRLTHITIALASLVMVTGSSMLQLALLSRTMRFGTLAIIEVVSLSVGLGVSIVAALNGLGYWSLVLNQAATGLTSGAIAWATSRWQPSWPKFGGEALSVLRFGGNVTISNVAGYLNTTLDNALVGVFLGEQPLGYYDRAWKFAVMPLAQLMAPVNRIAIPVLSRLSPEPERYRNVFTQMLQTLLLITLPGFAFAVVASEPLIRLVLGAKWLQVAPVFSWLCVGALVTPVNIATFWLFISQGRARDQRNFVTTAVVINVIAYAVGLHWGLIGVARVSALSVYVLQTPLLVWSASRSGPVDKVLFVRLLAPFFVSTAASALALTVILRTVAVSGLPGLLGAALFSYVTSFAVLACFESGRRAIRNSLTTVRSRFAPPGALPN